MALLYLGCCHTPIAARPPGPASRNSLELPHPLEDKKKIKQEKGTTHIKIFLINNPLQIANVLK